MMILKSLNALPSWLRLAIIFPILFLNGFLLALLLDYLQPFFGFLIVAAILAFLLEMLIQLLVQRGVKRGWAIATVLLLFLFTVIILGLIVIPSIAEQLGQLIQNFPEWLQQTIDKLEALLKLPIFQRSSVNWHSLLGKAARELSKYLESFGSQVLNLIVGTIASVINTLVILILTIFLLVGGEKFWNGVFSWVPSPWDLRVRSYLKQTFKDYFFSRLLLAGISSVVRTVAFLLMGVPYALLFAFGIGVGGLIPFAGGILTLFSTFILIFKDVGLGLWFFLVATIIDQLTDNVVAPRLMGELIGLNPIWLIIALFIGGKMAGILGLLLAVPLASVIKHLVDDFRAGTASPTLAQETEDPTLT